MQTETAPLDRIPQEGEEVAVMETNHGRIVLMFFPDRAPNHVENFKNLARSGAYDGCRFHRIIPGFMIQGGNLATRPDRGSGISVAPLKAEFNDVHHARGVLSAARTSDPNSATSQFFLMHQASPHLDRQYSAYGKAVSGESVIDEIVNLPRDAHDDPLPDNLAIIESVRIEVWPLGG